MGYYSRGDVVIASVGIDGKSGVKTRPAMVIGTGERNDVFLCPISSRPATDTPCVPVSLDDFSEGGLDLFGESYVLVSRIVRIRCGEIMGKKGRLTDKTITTVMSLVPQSLRPDRGERQNPRRSGAGK
jgi:mRNA-degrading endonuclease toxin of MazEF toxin-antitoxin module